MAKAENVPLLDLYKRIAECYDPMGQEAVTALFADKRVHTSKAGAELNASSLSKPCAHCPMTLPARTCGNSPPAFGSAAF
ncbi:MAG: hypothetical protein M3N54_16010 [Acidobacteriota bacterium]|nr:hypothetical protein [Acidobacteriota bacterium]